MPKKQKITTFAAYRGIEQLAACYFDLVEVGGSSPPAATNKTKKK